jgi:hypothetical protein
MPKIRHLHKLVAELANRKPMEKILASVTIAASSPREFWFEYPERRSTGGLKVKAGARKLVGLREGSTATCGLRRPGPQASSAGLTRRDGGS